jgi:hypothetical protein
MIRANGMRRAAPIGMVVAVLLALGGCSDEGAAAGGNGGGFTQNVPGPGTPTDAVAVTVSGAIPVSGNAELTGRPGSTTPLAGTRRLITADAGGGGLAHRIVIDFDTVTGTVFSVTHGWGPGSGAFDAVTQCVGTVTVAGQQLCGGVVLSLSGSTVTFNATVLRGSGTFNSILSGRVPFTLP